MTLILSPDGADGSARIAQDARIFRILAKSGASITHKLAQNRGLWLHIARGEAHVGDVHLTPGDAISLEHPTTLAIVSGNQGLEALLLDLG